MEFKKQVFSIFMKIYKASNICKMAEGLKRLKGITFKNTQDLSFQAVMFSIRMPNTKTDET